MCVWASSVRVCFFFSFFVARRCEGLGVCPCLVCVCRCLLFSTTAFPSFVFGTGDAAVPRAKQVRCASSRPPLLWRCVSFLPKAHGPTMATRHERIRASLCLALPVRCNVRPAVQQCHPDPSTPPPRQAQSHNEREDLWWARGGRGWPWCRGAAATRQLGTQQVFSVSCLLVVVVGLDGRALARRDPWEASRAARHKRHVSVVPHHHLPPFFCTAPVENSSKGACSCLLLLEDLDLLPPPPLHHRQRTRTRPQPSFLPSPHRPRRAHVVPHNKDSTAVPLSLP